MAILYNENDKTITLHTDHTSYQMKIGPCDIRGVRTDANSTKIPRGIWKSEITFTEKTGQELCR